MDEEVVFILALLILFILFGGEPDLMDAIISWIQCDG